MNDVTKNPKTAKRGFTLIELSIVLVIIGLIVGGILVGQDLIKAAEIRATVSQLEKYNTAVNVFRGKYNGIPGDLLNASLFGFDSSRGTAGLAGNGLIEALSAGTAATYISEVSCFWDDLSTAGLIGDNLNQSTLCGAGPVVSSVGGAVPAAKLGKGNFIIVGNFQGVNFYSVTGITTIAAGAAYTTNAALTQEIAYQIDTKVDDGVPDTGTAGAVPSTAIGSSATSGAALFGVLDTAGAAASATVCVVNTTPKTYNFATSSGKDQACQMKIRATF